MLRNLSELAARDYDLVIVGGGIFGVCAAWDASLRGLSVALLEASDFAHGASANCFKMIHGGIRYLQHADLIRLRQSTAERSAFLRIAPHLARPLPILIPTYGHGMKGKEILATGMKVYDLLTADRNRGIADRTRHIPGTYTLSGAGSRRGNIAGVKVIPGKLVGLNLGAVRGLKKGRYTVSASLVQGSKRVNARTSVTVR